MSRIGSHWKSLSQWEVPQWFDDAVLGIYCHWGVYSVPAFPFDSGAERVDSGLWYGMFMYNPDNPYGVYDFHCETYG
ncbi:MAG: alpha-L-fucosidase, partial [Planctomycetota bacterium]